MSLLLFLQLIKVQMSDGGSKTLLVDERQTVREVLDKLFEKTHCDCSLDWSLCEINPELQTGETSEHTCCTYTCGQSNSPAANLT